MSFNKTFFCSQCGTRFKGQSKTCPNCGFNPQSATPYGDIPALGSGGIGWSDKINDPLYAKYQGSKRAYIFLFSLVLIIGIPIVLLWTGDLALNREGTLVITVVAVMFFLIALFSIHNTKRYGEEWEGIVENKKDYVKNKDTIQKNVLIVRLNNHKTKELSFSDNDVQYEYYKIGDRIKIHNKANLKAIEKYNKSRDEILFCPSCGYVCDTRDYYCQACGSPLLKGSTGK